MKLNSFYYSLIVLSSFFQLCLFISSVEGKGALVVYDYFCTG
jgi:hypothetical protein